MDTIDMGWIKRVWGHLRSRRNRLELTGWMAAQSTVEYALVGALVVIAAATALTVLGGQLTNVFTHIANTLGAASAGH